MVVDLTQVKVQDHLTKVLQPCTFFASDLQYLFSISLLGHPLIFVLRASASVLLNINITSISLLSDLLKSLSSSSANASTTRVRVFLNTSSFVSTV